MSYQSWYQQSAAVICRAMDEARDVGLDGGELVRYVDASYPFGPRKYFPYKMWLKARGELLFGRKKIHARDKALAPIDGQLSLFSHDGPAPALSGEGGGG